MKKVAVLLAEHLKRWGTDHVFGIPGKPVVPLLVELEAQDIRFVLTRHESGGGFAASGYTVLQEETLGVAIGTSGPGGTNLLTAAGQAKAYHAPTLFITGQPSVKDAGKALGQDSSIFGTDLVRMFEQVTLFSARVDRGDQLEMYLRHAVEKATTGRKGPVHLSIPMEVLMEEIPSFTMDFPSVKPTFTSNQLSEVVTRLGDAEKPVLFLGKGVHSSKAYEEVKWLAERWKIPVMTSPGGKGTFVTNHPFSLGPLGLGGNEEATRYLEGGVDEMIVIGSKLSDMSLAGFSAPLYPQHVIQFDYDSTFIQKSLPVPTLNILGDARENLLELKRLTEAVEVGSTVARREFQKTRDLSEEKLFSSDISAKQALKELRNHLPGDTVLFGDDGSHTFYAIKHFDIYEPGTFYFDDVFGAMGHAIGYSIGAKVASPGKTIVCLTGDGCTFMHGAEIATAVDERLPLLFAVLNNNGLDMVDKGMKKMLGHAIGSTYQAGLNVKAFGESLGAKSFRCKDAEDIKLTIEEALTNKTGPSVIEIMVDPEEIPPILNRV